PITLMPHLVIGLLDVVSQQDRFADSRIICNLPVDVFAPASVLECRLAKHVDKRPTLGSRLRPLLNALVEPTPEVFWIEFFSDLLNCAGFVSVAAPNLIVVAGKNEIALCAMEQHLLVYRLWQAEPPLHSPLADNLKMDFMTSCPDLGPLQASHF